MTLKNTTPSAESTGRLQLLSGLVSPVLVLILTLSFVSLYALYQRFLPKPIPGIPYNEKASKRLLGDAPDMMEELKVTSEFNLWCARQVEKMRSPLCQVFVNPFTKPWLLLADFPEAQDIMMRRKEFDRSTFISDGMLPLGNFQARAKTNEDWKASRLWVQDLMTPTFLNNFAGPSVHSHVLELVSIWTTKARLAKSRPFKAAGDLMSVATDTMISFSFGDNLDCSDAKPQLDLLAQLDPSKLDIRGYNDEVVYPQAPIHEFVTAAHQGTEIVEVSVNAWIPRLLAVWHRNFSQWYRGVMDIKERVVREQIGIALQNVRKGEVKTSVEHMLVREEAIASKAGRQPDYFSQKFKDEVCMIPLLIPIKFERKR